MSERSDSVASLRDFWRNDAEPFGERARPARDAARNGCKAAAPPCGFSHEVDRFIEPAPPPATCCLHRRPTCPDGVREFEAARAAGTCRECAVGAHHACIADTPGGPTCPCKGTNHHSHAPSVSGEDERCEHDAWEERGTGIRVCADCGEFLPPLACLPPSAPPAPVTPERDRSEQSLSEQFPGMIERAGGRLTMEAAVFVTALEELEATNRAALEALRPKREGA